jgi:PIN domain nuclease of toxin-antitoxin system
VLDACALIALFRQETGMDTVMTLIDGAVHGKDSLFMHTVNRIEVQYRFYRELEEAEYRNLLTHIDALPIRWVDSVDSAIANEATRLKSRYRIPIGDAVGLATAVRLDGTFVTADHHELEAVEQAEPIPFYWFR